MRATRDIACLLPAFLFRLFLARLNLDTVYARVPVPLAAPRRPQRVVRDRCSGRLCGKKKY